ncbi:MAG TPA: hypothetical protein VE959_03765 [Bryobacteraceae bacterium]|nr:hypothetical protein [Bryobacteraceae bacterium]
MKPGLKLAAVLLGAAIVIVPFLGLDALPRDLRKQIDADRAAVVSAQKQLASTQDEVLGDLTSDPALFGAVAASGQWPEQLSKALGDLQFASRDMEQLSALEKQNRGSDRSQAESLLAQERGLRTGAMNQAAAIQKEAVRWVDFKRHLPDELQAMEREYNAVHGFDLAPVTNTVQKAEADWPEKQADLESRLAGLRGFVTRGDAAWNSSAEARRVAAAGDLAKVDLTALVSAAGSLKESADSLPKQSDELQSLGAQLYGAWDKVLIDMEVRSGGGEYDQKIRTVNTHLADANAKTGEITSDEKWVPVSHTVYESQKNDLGMAIEHKPGGKYDFEAERVAQPAGFAYVAPPSQGSNQYGYWEHRGGGDFWVFYGQYALLRDLLFNRQYQPLPRGDWEEYRTYHSRGETYYGRDTAAGQNVPRYGTQGTTTQDRYSGSTFAKGGGFKDSKYASKSGSFSSSKYASPEGDRTPKRYGSGSRPEEPHAAPPPRTYRPQPRPSFRPSAPRRFGKH